MKKLFQILLVSFIFLCFVQQAAAQGTDEFTIGLSRDFGYGGNGEIQGTFSIHIRTAPESVQKVAFFIDGNQIGEDIQAPFALQFSTDTYPAGMRSIYAIGYTSDNQELTSNKIEVVFVAEDEVGGKVFGMVGPLFAVILSIVALGFIVPMVMERKKGKIPLGAQQNYGLMGGTICPKCGRPFAMHLMKLNMGLGALDRCPHCGKWSVVRSKPLHELRAAEAAELANAGGGAQVGGMSAEDKLKKDLDDSKYQNL